MAVKLSKNVNDIICIENYRNVMHRMQDRLTFIHDFGEKGYRFEVISNRGKLVGIDNISFPSARGKSNILGLYQ